MNRADRMTDAQKTKWASKEEWIGRSIPRSHQNCREILGVARPGKTNKDRAKEGRGE